jgi:hypothetical protein
VHFELGMPWTAHVYRRLAPSSGAISYYMVRWCNSLWLPRARIALGVASPVSAACAP